MRRREAPTGQALVEMALITPLFVFVLAGIIVLGLGVFYQQQLSSAAREAARYASIHSLTSQCPTWSNDPPSTGSQLPGDYVENKCDPPHLRWPAMTAHARSHVFGLDPAQVQVVACWSGYWGKGSFEAGQPGWDAAPVDELTGEANDFHGCSVRSNDPDLGLIHVDPRTSIEINPATRQPMDRDGDGEPDRRPIECSTPMPLTTEADDMASSLAFSNSNATNQVTVFACYRWSPPFFGIPFGDDGSITLRAVVTEAMQHQK